MQSSVKIANGFSGWHAEVVAGLELHAASCAECAKELQAWKSLSIAAQELRDYQDSLGTLAA